MQATAEAAATRSKPPNGDEMAIRRITVAEYHRMGEAGIFGPEERVELLDGQLIEMPPGGPPHCYSVDRVTSAFHKRFSGRAYIRAQGPVTLDRWSEPEPDVMLSALPEAQYAVAHPKPSQILLVVEVAVSSLRYDAGAKLGAYARRGVREYWSVDVEHEHVDVFREPKGECYKHHHRAARGDSVAPLAFPDDAIPVNDILPPPR